MAIRDALEAFHLRCLLLHLSFKFKHLLRVAQEGSAQRSRVIQVEGRCLRRLLQLLPAINDPSPHLDVVAGHEDHGFTVGQSKLLIRAAPAVLVDVSKTGQIALAMQLRQHVAGIPQHIAMLFPRQLCDFTGTHGRAENYDVSHSFPLFGFVQAQDGRCLWYATLTRYEAITTSASSVYAINR